MFAYVISELREWKERDMLRTILASTILLSAVLGFSSLHPLIVLWAFALWSLWFGWSRGNRYRRGSSSVEKTALPDMPERAIVAGTLIASSFMFFMMAAALSPALAIMAKVWGPSARLMAMAAIQWYPLFILGLGVGISNSRFFQGDENFIGALSILGWFMLTLLIKPISFMNPFLGVWLLLKGSRGLSPLLCAIMNSALAALLLLLSSRGMARLRRNRSA